MSESDRPDKPEPEQPFFAQAGQVRRQAVEQSPEEMEMACRDLEGATRSAPLGVLSSDKVNAGQVAYALRVAEEAYDTAQALEKRVGKLAKKLSRLQQQVESQKQDDKELP